MTYDERQEIELYLSMLEKNIDRVKRNMEMFQKALEKIPCEIKNEPKDE